MEGVNEAFEWTSEANPTIKNQGKSKACAFFASTTSEEAMDFLNDGYIRDLSVQEMYDRFPTSLLEENGGPDKSRLLEQLNKYKFLSTEENYPFKIVEGCMQKQIYDPQMVIPPQIGAKWKMVAKKLDCSYEVAMEDAVQINPLVVLIHASNFFKEYETGVFNEGNYLPHNHAVTIKGFGVTDVGVKYWIVQNSWGENWGDQGCIRVHKGIDACGIEEFAYYPTPLYARTARKMKNKKNRNQSGEGIRSFGFIHSANGIGYHACWTDPESANPAKAEMAEKKDKAHRCSRKAKQSSSSGQSIANQSSSLESVGDLCLKPGVKDRIARDVMCPIQ